MQSDSSRALTSLRQSQNEDGGWGYRCGASWTEATAYAMLALQAAGDTGSGWARGLEFLRRTQRPDGGWAPSPAVAQSTWVTALALLAVAGRSGGCWQRADQWLREQSGRESSYIHRIRQWMLGTPQDMDNSHRGWPWFPETAAWVAPSAIGVLALEAAERLQPAAPRRSRIESGIRFLLARRCMDAGWNHGSTRALGYDGPSYPETTGMALLALHSLKGKGIEPSLDRAMKHLQSCSSLEARCWLELGLRAQGWSLPSLPPYPEPRGLLDGALLTITLAAARGTNVFLSAGGHG